MKRRRIRRIEHWTLDWERRLAVSDRAGGDLPVRTTLDETVEGFHDTPIRSPHFAAARGAIMTVYGPTHDDIHYERASVNRE